MPISAEERVSTAAGGALLCVADAGLAEELTRELNLCAHVGSVRVATNLPELIERMEQDSPCVIWLDDGVFQDAPLSELLRQLTRTAPVILLASAERQSEILRMVAEGEVEFVARRGDFIQLAACLVERRLR
jgi:chemotaxis response regulator CheB